ncbi:MAG: hypothetical protein HC914_00205 [Chloroflexaceae bacterium]|nr:hypothetical protein [Chloroflexaceae bacterium]
MPDTLVWPRIPAAKNLVGDLLIYYSIMRPAFVNHFYRVRVQIVGRLPQPYDGPLILYMNHSAWWDLYMTALLNYEVFRRRFDSYGMMEEQQLRRYRFFTWMGAFSIHRSDRAEATRSLVYISRVLQEQPGRALYMFPQGQIVPNDQRPLKLYTGVARIARQIGRWCCVRWRCATSFAATNDRRPLSALARGTALSQPTPHPMCRPSPQISSTA